MLIHVVNDCSTISFLEKFTCVLLTVQTSTITQAHTHKKAKKEYEGIQKQFHSICASLCQFCLFVWFFLPLILVQFSVYTFWNGFMVMVWCANPRHFVSFHFSFIGNIYGFFFSKKKKNNTRNNALLLQHSDFLFVCSLFIFLVLMCSCKMIPSVYCLVKSLILELVAVLSVNEWMNETSTAQKDLYDPLEYTCTSPDIIIIFRHFINTSRSLFCVQR